MGLQRRELEHLLAYVKVGTSIVMVTGSFIIDLVTSHCGWSYTVFSHIHMQLSKNQFPKIGVHVLSREAVFFIEKRTTPGDTVKPLQLLRWLLLVSAQETKEA